MDDLQQRINTLRNNYKELVKLESEERKITIEMEKKLNEEQNKLKEERKKLYRNKLALNKLEEQFHLQKQRVQLIINATDKHNMLDDDKNTQDESSDENTAIGNLELDKSNSEEKELKTIYKPLLTWLKDKFEEKINYVKISDSFIQVPMALVVSECDYDENGKRIDGAQACQKRGGDTTTNSCLSQTRGLEINPQHPLIKGLLSLIKHSKDDKITFNFAHVMVETTILRFGYSLEISADFPDCIEQVLQQAMAISLNETVENEPNDDDIDSEPKQ